MRAHICKIKICLFKTKVSNIRATLFRHHLQSFKPKKTNWRHPKNSVCWDYFFQPRVRVRVRVRQNMMVKHLENPVCTTCTKNLNIVDNIQTNKCYIEACFQLYAVSQPKQCSHRKKLSQSQWRVTGPKGQHNVITQHHRLLLIQEENNRKNWWSAFYDFIIANFAEFVCKCVEAINGISRIKKDPLKTTAKKAGQKGHDVWD